MSATPNMPADVVEFEYQDTDAAHPLTPGYWSWRVIENRRVPVVRCSVCGQEAYFPSNYTVASDGLIGSTGGRGFTCRRAVSGCPVKGRYLLRDFKAHSKAMD